MKNKVLRALKAYRGLTAEQIAANIPASRTWVVSSDKEGLLVSLLGFSPIHGPINLEFCPVCGNLSIQIPNDLSDTVYRDEWDHKCYYCGYQIPEDQWEEEEGN